MPAKELSLQELSARLEQKSKGLHKRQAAARQTKQPGPKQLSDELQLQYAIASSLPLLDGKQTIPEQLANASKLSLENVFPKSYSKGEPVVFDGAWCSDKALFSFLSWSNSSHRRLQNIEWLSDGSFRFRYKTVFAGIALERTAVLSDSHKNVNLGGVVGFASGASVRFSLKSLFERNGLEAGSVLPASMIPSFSLAASRKRLSQRYALPPSVGTLF